MTFRSIFPSLLVGVLCASIYGQTQILTTPTGLPGGNQNDGVIFDLAHLSAGPVTIYGLSVVFAQAGLVGVALEVWAISGTAVGNQTNSSAWTLIASGVLAGPSSGPGSLDATNLCFVGIPVLVIPPAGVIGLYVTTTGGGPQLVYSTFSGSVGGVVTNNGTLEVRSGFGGTYPFGSQFAPRSFNGQIRYQLGASSPSPWVQENTPSATLTVDGQVGSACQAASARRCLGETIPLVLASDLGPTVWDLIIQAGEPTVPGIVSPGGQVVNLDLAQGPGFWVSLGGGSPLPGSFPLSTLQWPAGFPSLLIPLMPAAPFVAHAQAYWVNPAQIDFLSISAPGRVQVVNPGGPAIPFLLGDDTSVNVDLTALCLPPMSYYGVSYTSFFVNANGSVSFVQPASDFSSSVVEFVTQMPRIAGLWTDLSPQVGGSVSATTIASGITVNWSGVPQFNTNNANSVSVSLSATGTTSISSYTPSPNYMFAPSLVGFSPGGSATNPGSLSGGISSYLGLGNQTGNIPSDAIFEFNLFTAPAAGWSTFTLSGNGSSWQVQ
jgi:hypothetical protein